MKKLKYLLRFYTQSQVAELLGYKHRSSLTHIINTGKIPPYKLGVIDIEYKKCKEKR